MTSHWFSIFQYDDTGDGENCFRTKTSEFLTDAAERIIIMDKVHKRIMAKFHEFLLWLGVPKHLHNDYRAHQICKIISEFSLEFRTTRERVQQVILASHWSISLVLASYW